MRLLDGWRLYRCISIDGVSPRREGWQQYVITTGVNRYHVEYSVDEGWFAPSSEVTRLRMERHHKAILDAIRKDAIR